MPFDAEDNLFLLPGPVKIHPRVLRAMMAPAVGHRSAEFKQVIRDLSKGLRYLFQTKGRVTAMTASATAGMEAAVSNLVGPADKIVVLVNGKFGERFADIARRYCPSGTILVPSPMGAPADLSALEAALAAGGVKAVAAVLNESSTGVLNPGERIAALCRQHDAFFIADGVTAIGGTEVPFDRWDIDVAVVGSQKCLGAPPGLTFLACSEEAYRAFRSPSLYLDLKRHFDGFEEQETPFTPATHLMLASAAALDLLVQETLEKRIERTAAIARATRAGITGLGLPLLCDPAIASPTVTAVQYPPGLGDPQVRDVLKRDFGIVTAGGQGEMKGKIFRVGHMGFTQRREMASFLAALEEALERAGAPVVPGAAMRAFRAAG